MFIFKICERSEWQAATKAGCYLGSSDDLRDGFIHLSTAKQLAVTASKHFAGRDNLLLIAFTTEDLSENLRWEKSRGDSLFPHVYGSLNTDDAQWVESLPLGPDGHVFPDRDLS